MSDGNSEIEVLRNEVASLKKKLGIATILGLILGGGGVFGVYKWVDSDRKLTTTEIRQKHIETEIAKNEALNRHYSAQITQLERRIKRKGVELKQIEQEKKELEKIEAERRIVNEKFRRELPATLGLD